MMKWFPAGLALLLLLGGQAAAFEPSDEPGRYQVIPDAVVPGKNGALQKRTLLLDTLTGLTWVISRDPKSSKRPEPLWVPVETKSPVAPQVAPIPAKKPEPIVSKPEKRKPAYQSNRLDRRFHNYDSNP